MDSNSSSNYTVSFLPTGDGCENCGSTTKVRKFRGKRLCKSCRNQWAVIN